MRLLTCLVLLFTLPACVRTVGEHCEVNGDGFTRRDPCEEMCIEWAITCPAGHSVTPDECSGPPCVTDDDCGDGLTCLQIDSVVANSRCMRAQVCALPDEG